MRQSILKGTSGKSALMVATQAARAAGSIIRKQFDAEKVVSYKGPANIVTQTDLAAEEAILRSLRAEFPDHGILSEESGETASAAPYLWVVDPLDGTMNFSVHLPYCAVSIALLLNGEPIVAVVHDPIHGELFVAERGRGARLGGKPIRVSQKTDFAAAVCGFDLGYEEECRRKALAAAVALRPAIQSLRLVGSAVLGQTYVACGRFDLYFHQYLFPWDVAAALLLLREAGATVTDWEGEPITIQSRVIIAANSTIHGSFLEIARKSGLAG